MYECPSTNRIQSVAVTSLREKLAVSTVEFLKVKYAATPIKNTLE